MLSTIMLLKLWISGTKNERKIESLCTAKLIIELGNFQTNPPEIAGTAREMV